jgi:hypothetical protein
VVAVLLATFASPVRAQVDTTETAPPDTTVTAPSDTTVVPPDTSEAAPPDTSEAAPPDTTQAPADTTQVAPPDAAQERSDDRQELPGTLRQLPGPVYGRPVVDSLPGLIPHAGIERVLARQPGSFLYDLGAVGWPHGWSPRGLGPNRVGLWLNGHPYDSPLTGRARFDLLPMSFLERPAVGRDPGGSAVGVHASWRDYEPVRPLTELRFWRDTNGLQAIEVGHSQKHTLSLLDGTGLFQISFGYGGRAADGAYNGSDLQRERRLWGRLRYQRAEWAVELSDLSSRHRIGAHSGVVPEQGAPFSSIYVVPGCEDCIVNSGNRRNTFRNDLTARVRGPLLPVGSAPTDLSATWTSNTFDFEAGGGGFGGGSDTTWTVRMRGGHGRVRQPLRFGDYDVTLGVRGSLWGVDRTNVPQVGGTRWSAHAFARDTLRVRMADLALDAGWHVTSNQQYPSAAVRGTRALGPVRLTASVSATGQRASWFETDGFAGFVRPLPSGPASLLGRVLQGRVGVDYQIGALDLRAEGFGHQIREALDLYAAETLGNQRVASTDSVEARRTSSPVRRVGGTVSIGWRRNASRGLYLSGQATALTTLSSGASTLQTRLARTLPTVYGTGRIGARFVFFVDLVTDLYVEARGWTSMNSRWFHPPTGRLVVPPAEDPVPTRPGFVPGPNGTVDVRAEIKLRGATLFFSLENAHVSFKQPGSFERQATLQSGTFTVPVYPLPARQFRFGVHWPIFD